MTRRIAVGTHTIYAGEEPAAGWRLAGNTAQQLLSARDGIVAHCEVRRDGVELTWLLGRPCAGSGDLMIEAEVSEGTTASTVMAGVAAEPNPSVSLIKVGKAVAVDREGRTWPAGVELADNRLIVTVCSQALEQARFPLAVDPLVTPHFALDAPTEVPTPCTRAAPVIAANDSGYLAVWAHGSNEVTLPAIYGARIDPTGRLLDPNGFLISTQAREQTVCAVAANPGMFLVTWAAPHGTSVLDWDILGARITTGGFVLDSLPLPICTVAGAVQNSPAVAGNGANFLVTWRDSRNTAIYGTLVATNGSLSVANGMQVLNGTADQYTPAVASLGSNYLVVAQDYRKASSAAYNSDIYGARVDGQGALLDLTGFAICTNSGSQFHPAVAADGTNWLVVWQDYDIGGSDIRAARVSPTGAVLDTNSFVVCHGTNMQANPAVAANDGVFLVAWQDYRQTGNDRFQARVYGARVTGNGVLLDAESVQLSSDAAAASSPSVAACAGEWFTVWQDFRDDTGAMLSDVFGARVSASTGLSAAEEMRISGAWNAQLAPAVAALGTNYLAVWADNRHSPSNSWDICGVRLSADGSLLDLNALWICTAASRQSDPAIAAGKGQFLVAWSDWRNTPPVLQHADIYGALVGLDGTIAYPNGIPICTATNDQSMPAVAPLGTNFLVVWQDARSNQPPNSRIDIYGARVTQSGEVLDPAGFAICTNLAAQVSPAVAASASQALVVWTDSRMNSTLPDIYGARVLMDGRVADTNSFPICAVSGSTQNLPAVASDGNDFLVVWADSRSGSLKAPDIYGARVVASGVVSPQNGFAIRAMPGPQTAPDVTFNGLDYLVTWQETLSATNSFDIYAVQLDGQNPSTAGPVLPVITNATAQAAPVTTAGADGRFLVINQDAFDLFWQTRAAFVNSEAVPRLDGLSAGSHGEILFRFRGAPGARYSVESSTDLRTWSPLRTFTNAGSPILLSDPAATNFPFRFYRAVLMP